MIAATRDLRTLKGFLLDMDGTVYLGDRVFPGAREFIALLARQGKKHLWLTNNSSRSAAEWAAKLRRLGFPAHAQDVFTSGNATIAYLLRQKPRPRVFALANPGFQDEMREAGCVLTADAPDFVVLGFDMTLTYEKVKAACLLIRRGVPFIASHPDKTCPTEDGFIPDCGAMAAMITEATGVKPIVLGKPFREMVDGALQRIGLPPHEVAMVGDRLYTDMRMARNAGVTAILVLTGETTRADLAGADIRPDFVFESIAELAEEIADRF